VLEFLECLQNIKHHLAAFVWLPGDGRQTRCLVCGHAARELGKVIREPFQC